MKAVQSEAAEEVDGADGGHLKDSIHDIFGSKTEKRSTIEVSNMVF